MIEQRKWGEDMFPWMRKRKIGKIVPAAKTYLSKNYLEPVFKPDSGEIDLHSASQHGEKAVSSLSGKPSHAILAAKFSVSDQYDSRKICSALRESTSVQSFLSAQRALDSYSDMSFVDKIQEYIRTKHLRDVDVYKAAQIDRRLFSKLMCDHMYTPSKDTCAALALALQLSLNQANDLLTRAGYALSHSSKRDLAIEYCFTEHIYNINDVNELLYQLGLKTMGR